MTTLSINSLGAIVRWRIKGAAPICSHAHNSPTNHPRRVTTPTEGFLIVHHPNTMDSRDSSRYMIMTTPSIETVEVIVRWRGTKSYPRTQLTN
mmetsp:Transcript_16174/g.27143  ORF Transcript_16174/g.27143 Transcript_16174/m.27143 type:complete len:93 (-) Transcript_16174:1-279(-)